jgi:predicted nucleic acid-binding protein
MVYLDTSVLVAYYCPEPTSHKIEALLKTKAAPAITELTELEMYSALSRKIREGGLEREDAVRILAQFQAHLDGGWYTKLPLETRHYRLAKDWMRQFHVPLRSLDALHLAVAASAQVSLITADVGMAKAAEALSVATVLVKG